MDEQIKAVIDADFFRNITEYEMGTSLFLKVMDNLGMIPVMHEFVANTELKGNKYLKSLLNDNKILIVHYAEYLKDEDKEEYEQYFKDAYETLNYFDFPNECDIYTYEGKGESLGEIRSLYMAGKMRYMYFMSDDAGSKLLASKFFSSKRKVSVKSLYDALIILGRQGADISWKDINPTVTNAMQKRQDRVKELRELYAKKV
ncbi:MAG: hypothetical protein NC433_07825 [Clostridiales bacterium]|nr:hypothetical protein [Clostridiales bacterium]